MGVGNEQCSRVIVLFVWRGDNIEWFRLCQKNIQLSIYVQGNHQKNKNIIDSFHTIRKPCHPTHGRKGGRIKTIKQKTNKQKKMGEIYVSAERIKTAKHIFNHGLHIIDFWITLDFFFLLGIQKERQGGENPSRYRDYESYFTLISNCQFEFENFNIIDNVQI